MMASGRESSVPRRSLAAIQDDATKRITVTERETPVPQATQVLVKVACTGVCASDLHISRGSIPWLRASVGVRGHEGAGTVAALGPGVDGSRWRVGDRVGVRWLHSVCGQCEPCTTGHENLCPSRRISGKDIEGCFAQYALAESRYLARLPDGVADADAAPVLCAGVTVYKALKVAQLRSGGSWVAVAGAGGGLGHLAIQYARAMGHRVVGIDAGKRDLCLELGAEAYVDVVESQDVVGDVIGATDGGAHGALVCTSTSQSYADAVKYLRRAGTLVCIGAPPSPKPTPIPVTPEDFIARGIKIVGTSTGSLADTAEAMEFVARGDVKPRIVERRLDEVEQVLEEMEAGRLLGRVVMRIPL